LSRFQKNALLTLVFLAAIAYPPLYYSIKNTIQKETLPKSYNSPSLIPKVSLGPWLFSEIKGADEHGETIRHLVALEFLKMSKVVYLGSSEKNADIKLGGDVGIDQHGIIFIPKISFPKHHKSYSSEKLKVGWEEIGKAPMQITNSYLHLIREKIRLNRFLLSTPEWPIVPDDLNPEILSHSEYSIYKSIFSKDLSDAEKSERYSILRGAKPAAAFIKYEALVFAFKSKGIDSLKDIWKDWSDNKFGNTPFTYLLSYEIAKTFFGIGTYEVAFDFFQVSRKERERQGNVYHSEYAESLSAIGQILVRQNKAEEALFYFTSAKEMLETLGEGRSTAYYKNQIHYSLLLAILGQREVALNEFYIMEPLLGDFQEFDRAVFYYNFARLEYSLSAFESALHYIQKSRYSLFALGLSNHELNFHNLLLSGAIQFQLKNYNLAQSIWEEILNAKLLLPIEDNLYYRNALLGMAYIYQVKGSVAETENYYKQYTRLSPYNAIVPFESKPNLQVTDYIQSGYYEAPKLDEFTSYEESVIKSYTGRYIFTGQDEEIRARTYQDRLEDTNEFLRDLIQADFFGTPALAFLKNALFPPKQSYVKGENIVFIDIGPALNNLEAPGITSQSVAYHFPKMSVVLWELPTEVELFLKKVPNEKKESLYSFGNIRIISADGVANFLESYADTNRWLFRNRNIPKLNEKTIIIRAANSIDIYETYTKIQPHFKDIAKSLKENPVLYFFNRSILLKPKGAEKFTLIGYQSVRGFHHNFQSLDRNGEPPYTLAKYTLSGN
jgi:hypothetical protein